MAQPPSGAGPAGSPALRDITSGEGWRAEVIGLRRRHRNRGFAPRLRSGSPGHRSVTAILLDAVRAGDAAQAEPPALAPGCGEVGEQDEPVVFALADLDAFLRVEVVAALVHRARRDREWPITWLARPGRPEPCALDRSFLAAAIAAYGQIAVPTSFVVVTRTGCYEPLTGQVRRWVRPRDRRLASGATPPTPPTPTS